MRPFVTTTNMISNTDYPHSQFAQEQRKATRKIVPIGRGMTGQGLNVYRPGTYESMENTVLEN